MQSQKSKSANAVFCRTNSNLEEEWV